jgi:hypothetical protein
MARGYAFRSSDCQQAPVNVVLQKLLWSRQSAAREELCWRSNEVRRSTGAANYGNATNAIKTLTL